MKELTKQVSNEMDSRNRLGKLISNPNITGFVPKGEENMIANNTTVLGDKSEIKTVLTGHKAKELNTPEKVLDYLSSKYMPEVFGDKICLYIFPEETMENIAQTEGGLLVHHEDNKQIKFRTKGDKEDKEERISSLGVVVSIGEGLTTDSGEFVKMHLKVGDLVIIGFYDGAEFSYDGVDYRVLREYNVIAKLPKKL